MEAAGNNTSSPTANVALLHSVNAGALAPTSLSFNTDGTINFSPSQVFPIKGTGGGTITGVTPGVGLTGGGISGAVSLALDTTVVPTLAANNTFTGTNTFSGALSAQSFTGDGSALTKVNASSLNGVNASKYAQLGANTFTGSQSIPGMGLNAVVGDMGCGAGTAGVSFGSPYGCQNYALLGVAGDTMINRPYGGTLHFRENNADEMENLPRGRSEHSGAHERRGYRAGGVRRHGRHGAVRRGDHRHWSLRSRNHDREAECTVRAPLELPAPPQPGRPASL